MRKLNLKQKFSFNRIATFENDDSNTSKASINFNQLNQFPTKVPGEAKKRRRMLIANNTIISLTSYNGDEKIATIYRQLSFRANIKNDEILIDYNGRLQLTGELEFDQNFQQNLHLTIEIKEVGCLESQLYYWNYPVSTIRAAYKIALISLLLGLTGLLTAAFQFLLCCLYNQ